MSKLATGFVFALALLIVIAPPTALAEPDAPPPWERCTADDAPQDDRSLEIAAYERAGVPSLSRPWGLVQLGTAFRVLTELAAKQPDHVPRWCSPRSGRLFERLVSNDHQREAFRLHKREEAVGVMNQDMAIHRQLFVVYRRVQLEPASPTLHLELARIFGFILRGSAVMARVGQELRQHHPELPFDGEDSNGVLFLRRTITLVENRPAYRRRVRQLVANYLATTLHILLLNLDPPARALVLADLDRVLTSERDPEIKALLAEAKKKAQ